MPRPFIVTTTPLGETPYWEIPGSYFHAGPPEYGWDGQYQGAGAEALVISAISLAKDLRLAGFHPGRIGTWWTQAMQDAFDRWVTASGVTASLEVSQDGRDVTLTPRAAIDVLRKNVRYGVQPYAQFRRPGAFHVQHGMSGLGAEPVAVDWGRVSPWVWVAGAATVAIFGAVIFMKGAR